MSGPGSILCDPTTSAPGGSDEAAMMEKMGTSSIDQELHYIMSAIVGPVFCVVGMLGNLLSMVTWSRPKMRSSTGRYLIGQAVADFAVLMFFILVFSVQDWFPDVKYSVSYGVFFSYVGYPGIFFAVVCSVWFTVGVTADRYLLVCWITKAKRYCNEKRANVGLLLITVNSFIINFPHYFSFSPVFPPAGDNNNNNLTMSDSNDTNNNATQDGCGRGHTKMDDKMAAPVVTFEQTEFTKGKSGEFYEFWIHCMLLIIIPWITVFTLNILIIRTVTKSNKKNADKKTSQSAKNSKDSENQITRLLLTVTFTFLFFIGIQCVVQCMSMRKPAGFNMLLVESSFAFAKCGIIFNSSLNFFLYCLTGRRFRKELLKVVGLSKPDSLASSSLLDRPSGTSSSHKSASTTSTSGM